MIGGGNDDVIAAWRPTEFRNVPRRGDDFPGLAGIHVKEPELGALVVFVGDMRIVFVLLFFFFGVRFGIRGGKRDLLAVRRPFERMNAALAFGERVGFAPVARNEINLSLLAAAGEKAEARSFGGPSWRKIGFLGLRELHDAARRDIEHPDMAVALNALQGLALQKSDTA